MLMIYTDVMLMVNYVGKFVGIMERLEKYFFIMSKLYYLYDLKEFFDYMYTVKCNNIVINLII